MQSLAAIFILAAYSAPTPERLQIKVDSIVNLNSRQILLIVSGGIAAYKALELVRRLREAGANVRVVMTPAAQSFVTALSFQALSGEPVHTSLLDESAEAAMGHIELARWAELVVVAPASADIIARLRAGLADDLATTLCLASAAPLVLAPAMNQQMWAHAATTENIAALKARGVHVLGPAAGAQACGDVGLGRMLEPEAIVSALDEPASTQSLAGCRVMITAGPTQEAIDPVRYISNRSSGKMGFAIAAAAASAGADVVLVSGPTQQTSSASVELIKVTSADDMYDAVMARLSTVDLFVAAAAVADYAVAEPLTQKRKKEQATLSLTLTPTRDILAAVTAQANPPFAVGFAAETENLIGNARSKLQRKALDMIAGNVVGVEGSGFDSDDNELHVLWDGGEQLLPRASKQVIAQQLVDLIATRYRARC